MTDAAARGRWERRARPLLGTLVEVGIDATTPNCRDAFTRAFEAIDAVQRCLSRFDPNSDVSRFNDLPDGGSLSVRPSSAAVLSASRTLQEATGDVFDITQGSGPQAWAYRDGWLHKSSAGVRLDVGGIGKGHAVDCAVEALRQAGCHAGWVNAGGDLRAFGHAEVPVLLRDERTGGGRRFAIVVEGSFATSHYSASSRSRGFGGQRAAPVRAHVSVAAPLGLFADALTKVIAATGDTRHPLLAVHSAEAWLHGRTVGFMRVVGSAAVIP